MFEIFFAERWMSAGMFAFFALSMMILAFLAVKYNKLTKEAENMSITKRKELKAIKTKFLNSYGEEIQGRINVEVFVDKSVKRLKICGLKPNMWKFMSVQILFFSIIFAGFGIFNGIVAGYSFRQISPFYLAAFLELYMYFSILSVLEFEEKENILRLTIIEYIENHMVNRIEIAKAFQAEEKVFKMLEEEQSKKEAFTKEKEKELEALLQEFLV